MDRGISDPPILDSMAALMQKGLLRRFEAAGEGRFWMLESIKDYSGIQLEQRREAALLRRRHADYFLAMAEKSAGALYGSEQTLWLERWEMEHQNFQEALGFYISHGEIRDALRLAVHLEWFWYLAGHFSDGREALEEIMSHQDRSVPPQLEARGLESLGWIAFLQGDWSYAKQRYCRSLELRRCCADGSEQAMVLARLGVVERWLGETDEGTRHGEEAVALARATDDVRQIVHALICAYSTTGGIFVGDPPRAELEEALRLSEQRGDRWGIAHALNGLGDLFRESGDYRKARARYAESLVEFRDLKARWMIAWTFEGLGRTSYADGDYLGAKQYLKESVKMFWDLGDTRNAGLVLRWVGLAECGLGRRAAAARLLGACETYRRTLDSQTTAKQGKQDCEIDGTESCCREEYPSEWAQGEAMTLAHAIRYGIGLAEQA
jgi:tetratricopeptide (TPR) repeat protein